MDQLAKALRAFRGRDAQTFIYAIQAGEDGPVKIGLAKDVYQRLLTLQTANPVRLQGLAAWRGSLEEEKALHLLFEEFRLEGEWFQPAPELLTLVDLLGGPPHCDFHRNRDCLAASDTWPLGGTCGACGMQFFGDDQPGS